MNLINLRAIGGGAYAPCLAEMEDAEPAVISFRQSGQAFRRRYLHMLYRETLKDYREAHTDWMRRATRQTLLNIWENYRNA
jgi:hypothetical protein